MSRDFEPRRWKLWRGAGLAAEKRPCPAGEVARQVGLVSTDGSNWAEVIPGIISEKELCEHFCWRPESEYSTGPVIYLVGHGLQVANVPGDIGAFREVLPDNSVGILIRSPLPRRVRVGEIHRDIGCEGEGGVLGHLGALVPGDRSAQVRGHVPDGLDDALADRFGVAAVRQRNRDKVPALALHQGSHRGFPRLADHEVTFPVARYFTALGLLGALRYRDHPDDPGTLGP